MPPPPRSFAAKRVAVDEMRPTDTLESIKSVLRDNGISRDVVSPQVGGRRADGSTRTKLSIIDDARRAMNLLPLVQVDPDSVRAHAYASAARSGNAATVAAVEAALGSPAPVPMGEPVVDSASDAPPAAPAAESPQPAARPATPPPAEPVAEPAAPAAPSAAPAELDQNAALEHVTVEPFPVPSFAAIACFFGVVVVLLAVVGWAYMLGAPLSAMLAAETTTIHE